MGMAADVGTLPRFAHLIGGMADAGMARPAAPSTALKRSQGLVNKNVRQHEALLRRQAAGQRIFASKSPWGRFAGTKEWISAIAGTTV